MVEKQTHYGKTEELIKKWCSVIQSFLPYLKDGAFVGIEEVVDEMNEWLEA